MQTHHRNGHRNSKRCGRFILKQIFLALKSPKRLRWRQLHDIFQKHLLREPKNTSSFILKLCFAKVHSQNKAEKSPAVSCNLQVHSLLPTVFLRKQIGGCVFRVFPLNTHPSVRLSVVCTFLILTMHKCSAIIFLCTTEILHWTLRVVLKRYELHTYVLC